MHYLIKDTDFTKILKFLLTFKRIHKHNDRLRLFIEAVFYICRSGCQWRLLPICYGSWRAVHKRFKNWSNRNIWQQLFEYSQQDPDLEWIVVDSTIVRAHACAAGYKKNCQEQEALGRSKGGFSTKIHTIVDALGNPLKFILTPGQRNDITQAKQLVKDITHIPVLADKAYDANDFINSISPNSCIPPRSNRKNPRIYDKHLYEERHVIECFFSKIKHFRRVFSRYDKSASTYLAFLHFVGTLVWIR